MLRHDVVLIVLQYTTVTTNTGTTTTILGVKLPQIEDTVTHQSPTVTPVVNNQVTVTQVKLTL